MNVYKNIHSIESDSCVLFFDKKYLLVQNHEVFRHYENDTFVFQCAIDGGSATSMPKSLFGSFWRKKAYDTSDFISFSGNVEKALAQESVSELTIKHPANIYSHFVSEEELSAAGYDKIYDDANQHIVLDASWKDHLHTMQRRKLKSLHEDGFEFRPIPIEDLKTVHQFISACRQFQGLEINISYDNLQKLASTTGHYDLFGVFRGEKLSSVCVCVRVTDTIAYYYLPATSPTFRNHSPMVLLIAGMADYYLQKGMTYFDMGVSSIEGRAQASLQTFKARMGAHESAKPVFKKRLTS